MAEGLILASASPRRAELLQQIDVAFTVAPADIDETVASNERAVDYVQRMAREKAQRVALASNEHAVLAADTVVVLNGEILGKPRDRRDAKVILTKLNAQQHEVMTAICLVYEGRYYERLSRSEVCFAALSEKQIDDYLLTGEADDKAGAYGIQGRAAVFVQSMTGSYSGIVGLPLYETDALLREAGLRI